MKMLNKRELRIKTSLAMQTIDRLEKAGRFPKRVWLSTNRVAWLESEVDEWLLERLAKR